MPKITVTFPDSSKREFEAGITPKEIAESIGPRLAKEAVAAEVDGKLADLSASLHKNSKLKIITVKDKEAVSVLRHSTAHILAEAAISLFSYAKPTIGPVVEEGFYYDFDHKPFNPEDLDKIEKKMKEIIAKNESFQRIELTKKKALELFKDNEFKVEMINELAEGEISAYKQGDFIDLCRGPHIPSTGLIKAVKITKLAGAYWRGDAKNKQLQRIYGISFFSQKELDAHLKLIEEAEKRDHRKIGKDLDLIYFHEFAPGAPFYLKKGAVIYNALIDFIRAEYRKRGYQEVITPQLYNKKLWEISGHWEHYKENMFIVHVEGQEHSLKPMNCPSHCLIYNRDIKSYKDLPVRIADFCNLHRNELSGTLSGLFRVRKFAQDDGHIFCAFDQIESEVLGVLEFIKYVWEDIFRFKLEYYLSTMPEKALGTRETWDKAEKLLANALKKAGIRYQIKPGEGAFYGPKIDIDIEDALGRKWQCPTCQLDFNLPERFSTQYEGADGKKHQAVMIHRAVLGSLERFMGVMIEHYAGNFPLWLSPVQAVILPIADRHHEYCENVKKGFFEAGIRVELDARAESTPKKVRDAQMQHINYILVVGDNEVKNGTVNVRTRDNKVHGEKKADAFLEQMKKEIEGKV
ncbi:threonine--tRNA ligase [Candidatus Woesearchaeota archaeon CG10_big_fil_rev_8_21_14_0_10_44_13]|nr:MAG: threonine--tRNA ligase [Candidatus Woesearchaeota archaeon CG10_big_fil_rev_8_21_14_0_10_44_13]